MFTGLVQAVGKIISSKPLPGGARELDVDISGLKSVPEVGASIAINGVCQTVTAVMESTATFCAVEETVRRSTLGRLLSQSRVNLEPALRIGDSIDGHFVLGHVDAVGRVSEISRRGSSEIWYFTLPSGLQAMFAEKGSIAIDGVSLTIAEVFADTFSVSLIPHTLKSTGMQYLGVGSEVNLEVDVLARYISRQLSVGKVVASGTESGGLDAEFLAENGFV